MGNGIDNAEVASQSRMQVSDFELESCSSFPMFGGMYKCVPARVINGRPVWQRQGGEQLMFFTKAGYAMIANRSENAMKGTGTIRSLHHLQLMDAWGVVQWAIFCREQKRWLCDFEIRSK